MKKRNNTYTALAPWGLLAVALVVLFLALNGNSVEVHELKTGELIQAIKKEQVTEITITPKSSESVYYIEGKLKDYDKNESFTAKVISEDVTTITEYAKEKGYDIVSTTLSGYTSETQNNPVVSLYDKPIQNGHYHNNNHALP